MLILAAFGMFTPNAYAVDARYGFLEKLHGHTCAGSLIGARLAMAAREAIGSGGKFRATYYDLSCPVDGIQVFAGTTLGNKALTVEDRDQHLLVLTDKKSGRKVEARLTHKAEEMGKSYRNLSRKIRSLPDESAQRIEVAQEIEILLDWFRIH
ncbi:MAG: formylmethanofuran dehydrogenase subunit E family protein [Deltaproteobacteria bacterium]|nr:formylmethanofuran dehydrogenase subunit E family protein [Deltaproteobacteria bacterium]